MKTHNKIKRRITRKRGGGCNLDVNNKYKKLECEKDLHERYMLHGLQNESQTEDHEFLGVIMQSQYVVRRPRNRALLNRVLDIIQQRWPESTPKISEARTYINSFNGTA